VKKVALTLRLPPEIYKGAKEMARERGKSFSGYICELLEERLREERERRLFDAFGGRGYGRGKPVPFHVPVDPSPGNGLKKKPYVKAEQLLTISKDRLVERIGLLEKELLVQVEEAIRLVLELARMLREAERSSLSA